jgi:anti-sigma B factor antagonist
MNYSRNDEDDATNLRIRGELDALSASELRPLLDEVVRDQRRQVIVDLSELRMVDSSGVGALVSLYKRVKGYGGEVTFTGVTAQPLVIFKLLRLDVVFGLPPSEPAREQAPALEAPPNSIRVLRT